MGNLIVENGKLRLPKVSNPVMIRLPNQKSLDIEKQKEIFDTFNSEWEKAKINFQFNEMGTREKNNEIVNERFNQDIEFNTGKNQPKYARTVLQENYFYIDFTGVNPGSAYQLTWQSSFKQESSNYISIDSERGLLKADILHEVGHALGLAHEHQRSDRGTYVRPNNQNQYSQDLESGQQIAAHEATFNHNLQSVPFGPYDYDSIMHYPGVFTRIENNQPIGGSQEKPIFPDKLSEGDLYTARFLYNEARISEYLNSSLDRQYDSLSLEFINKEKSSQEIRTKELMPPYNRSNCVINRTFNAVNSQLFQLERLKLQTEQIDQIDKDLFKWAKSNLQRVQQHHATSSQQSVNLFQPQEGRQPLNNNDDPPPPQCCA